MWQGILTILLAFPAILYVLVTGNDAALHLPKQRLPLAFSKEPDSFFSQD
jgi:hypothetical protein